MKRMVLALFGLLMSMATVWAQSVTMYGLVDTAIEHVTNVGPSGAGVTRMSGLTGTIPSRIGFRGSEELGGGLRAVFTLETGFAPDTGTYNQGGRAFGRQAFVGLSGPWGTLSMGRQYTMYFWSLLDADTLGPNIFGVGAFDAYINNARADNALAYMGKFGGFTAGATYSFGRDVVNAGFNPAGTNCPGESTPDTRACREWSLLLKYDSASWGAAAAIDNLRGGAGAAGGLSTSARSDRRLSVNGYTRFGALKVGGGLVRRENEGSADPRSDLWFLGVGYPVSTSIVIDAGVSRYKVKNTSDHSTLYAMRLTYNLSRRTAVYTTLGRIDNNGRLNVALSGGQAGGNPVAGGAQSGFALGIRHAF